MIEKLGERVYEIKAAMGPETLAAMKAYDVSLNESLRQAKGWRKVAYSEYVPTWLASAMIMRLFIFK